MNLRLQKLCQQPKKTLLFCECFSSSWSHDWFLEPVHARRLNGMDMIVPDGQPVRWALWWLHQKN